MKAAFTLDDLPIWPHSGPPPGYSHAGIVDAIIEALDRNGVKGVYAFCNSWALVERPETARILDRWVAAGHHVANHTHSHPELNDVGAAAYIDEIDRAERHLEPWLAKAPRRYFRYTLNYWGDTREKLDTVKAHLDHRGYTVAEVTTMFYEWDWDRAYRNCLQAHDQEGIDFLRRSFIEFSVAQLRHDMNAAAHWFGHEPCGITLGHNVAFFADAADELFGSLRDAGLEFVSLEEAVSDPAYDAVCSVVSDRFLVFQQKLADAAGKPMPVLAPAQAATYARIEDMAEGQPG